MRRMIAAACAGAGLIVGAAAAAGASNWPVHSAPATSGEASSGGLPGTPGAPSAVCTGALANTVTLSWTAVSHATSYTVLDATAAAAGPYTTLASGVATTTWTTPALATGNYWFEVEAVIGTLWQSPASGASAAESTIVNLPAACVQP